MDNDCFNGAMNFHSWKFGTITFVQPGTRKLQWSHEFSFMEIETVNSDPTVSASSLQWSHEFSFMEMKKEIQQNGKLL